MASKKSLANLVFQRSYQDMINDKLNVDNYIVGDVIANREVTQNMQYLILQKGYFTVKLFDSAAILIHNTEIKIMKAGLLKQFSQANNL